MLSHLAGESADEGHQVLDGYRGTVVVDGFAEYEVPARAGPGLTLAHCWAHTKRKYDDIAEHWPVACAEIRVHIGELCAIERLAQGPFPGDATAQMLRQQLRHERSRPILDRIWQGAAVQLARSASRGRSPARPRRRQCPCPRHLEKSTGVDHAWTREARARLDDLIR